MLKKYLLTLLVVKLGNERNVIKHWFTKFEFATGNLFHDRDMAVVKAKEILKNINDYVLPGEKMSSNADAKLLDHKNCNIFSIRISFENENDDEFDIKGLSNKESIGNLSYEAMLLQQVYPEIKLTKKIFEGYEYHVLKKDLNFLLNKP